MMKILPIFFILFFIISCSGSDDTSVSEKQDDFVDGYINTLETSVGDARDAAEIVNGQQETLQKSIDDLQ